MYSLISKYWGNLLMFYCYFFYFECGLRMYSVWFQSICFFFFNQFVFETCFMVQHMSLRVNILYSQGKNVYSSTVGLSSLQKSVKSRQLMVLVILSIPLFFFVCNCSTNCWEGYLKSSTLIVKLFFYPCNSVPVYILNSIFRYVYVFIFISFNVLI